MMKLRYTFLIVFLLWESIGFAQNVGINSSGAAPDASAGLDVNFSRRGVLIPRINIPDLSNAAPVSSPATSLVVYNTNTTTGPGYFYWDGSHWVKLFDANDGKPWLLSGNAGTTAGTDFLGTTDNVSLDFRTNNSIRMRITNSGNVGIGTTSPAHKLHVVNTIDGVSAIYATNQNISSSGTSWLYGDNVSGIRGISTLSGDYSAGVFGYRFGWGDHGAGVVGAWSDNIWGGLGCEENDNIWGMFTPVNAAVRGYLLVGNPSAPQSISSGATIAIYEWSKDNGIYGWVTAGEGCGNASWLYVINGLDGYYEFDNEGSRSYQPLYSPWMWVPSGSNIRIELSFNNTLEDGYDGVYLEYTTNGSSWTKVNNWIYNEYNDNIVLGSNSSCSGGAYTAAWTDCDDYGPLSDNYSFSNGTWLRFRLIGMEDGSVGTGDFRLYGFSVWAYNPSWGGNFTSGNIYAEHNVYAGSNVLLGDLAEYFKVVGISKPGMLIAVNPEKKDEYLVSKEPYNSLVIGVHSQNPTLTLNNPNSGVPVALAGRVPVLVTAKNGKINVGDYITSSDIKGVGMKADKSCYVIGIALEPYDKEKPGKILCLIRSGWYNVNTSFASGTFYMPNDFDEIIVYDDNITKNSKIFLSMLDDPQCRFWISEKNDGSFKVKFSEKAKGDIDFDYLVENAKISNNNYKKINNKKDIYLSKTKPVDFETGGWKYDSQKKIYWKEEPKNPNIKTLPIPVEVESKMPPIPDNPENVYIYYLDKKEMKTIYVKGSDNDELRKKELEEKMKEIKGNN